MKLLKMSIRGLRLFEDGLDIDFIAQQRVTEQNGEGLTHLFGNIYKQDVIGIVGINASGKTTGLRWISFLYDIYLKEGKVNKEEYRTLLQNQKITIEALFTDHTHLFKVRSVIYQNDEKEYVFGEEKLWEKNVTKSLNRKTIYDFSDSQLKIIRSQEHSLFLSDYISIMISILKKQTRRPQIIDQLEDTNINIMRVIGDVPAEVIQFLDNNVEYVNYIGDTEDDLHLKLKFKNQDKAISIYDPFDIYLYLSSGTIKGLNVFAGIDNVLKTGGTLIIDELENHFNEAVIKVIIQLFKNKKVNVTGATLVFSTHYAILLDEFERNDSIYISFKEDTLRLKKLSMVLNRDDYKKSEIYQSGYVGKTAPSYDDYMKLKKLFISLGKDIKQKSAMVNTNE